MIRFIGLLGTVIADIAIFIADYLFASSLTATSTDFILLLIFNVAISLIHFASFSRAGDFLIDSISGNHLIKTFILKSVALAVFGTLISGYLIVSPVSGALNEIDIRFMQQSSAKNNQDLKLKLANDKLNMLSVNKTDIDSFLAKETQLNKRLALEEAELKKCTWHLSCRTEVNKRIDIVKAELKGINQHKEARDNYLASINEATSTLNAVDSDKWKQSAEHWQLLSLSWYGTKEKAESVLADMRLLLASFIVLIASFGNIFFGGFNLNFKTDEYSPALSNPFQQSQNTAEQPTRAQSTEQPQPRPWVENTFGQSQPSASYSAPTAYSVSNIGDLPSSFAANEINANTEFRRSSHEFRAHDGADANAVVESNYDEPEFIQEAGFLGKRIPNPKYRPTPVIVQPEPAPRGVEIGFSEPDAVDAVSDCVQMDAAIRIQTDAVNADASANNGGGNGRGISSIMDYSDLVDAVFWSNYLQNHKKETGIIGQNRVQEFMGVGRPVAKRYIERLVADKIIDANWRVIK